MAFATSEFKKVGSWDQQGKGIANSQRFLLSYCPRAGPPTSHDLLHFKNIHPQEHQE
jgi:hypothetical protein